MDYLKQKWLGILITLIASLLLASHFAFQWYSWLALATFLFIAAVLLNKLIIRRFVDERVLVFIGVMVVFIFMPEFSGNSIEYKGCSYPPFKAIDGTDVAFDEYYQSYYVKDIYIEGLLTYTNRTFDLINLRNGMTWSYRFNVNNASEIHDISYLNNYVYVTGEYLSEDRTTSSNIYSLNRYNLTTKEVEHLFDSPFYINIAVINNELHVNTKLENQDRQTYIYNTQYELVRTDPSYEYIHRVDNFDSYDVVQKDSGIFLYDDGVLINEFIPSLHEYNGLEYIYFYDDHFRITTYNSSYLNYVDVFNTSGELVETDTRYELQDYEYVLFSDNYVIKNAAYYYNDLIVLESIVMDEKGNDVCPNQSSSSMIIVHKNGELYGKLGEHLYQVSEMTYSVPIKYEEAQTGSIYWLSILAFAAVIIKKEKIV